MADKMYVYYHKLFFIPVCNNVHQRIDEVSTDLISYGIQSPETIRKTPEFLFSVIIPPEYRLITWAQSAKVMSYLTSVVWWLRTATRVVFFLLWIWKYKIVVNNTFLMPKLTCETTIYWRRPTVPWDSKQRPLHKKIPQWCSQALSTINQLKVISNNAIKSTLSRYLYHVHFQGDTYTST